ALLMSEDLRDGAFVSAECLPRIEAECCFELPINLLSCTNAITSDQLISEYNMNRNQCEPIENPLWIVYSEQINSCLMPTGSSTLNHHRPSGNRIRSEDKQAHKHMWYTHMKPTATGAVSDQDVMTNTPTCHYTLSVYRPNQASIFLIGSASVTDSQTMFEVKLTALTLADGFTVSCDTLVWIDEEKVVFDA
ncbi:hypothetical protein CSKR_200148, partial [Clonorchis sinensis]